MTLLGGTDKDWNDSGKLNLRRKQMYKDCIRLRSLIQWNPNITIHQGSSKIIPLYQGIIILKLLI